jgi:hypothetical protein
MAKKVATLYIPAFQTPRVGPALFPRGGVAMAKKVATLLIPAF